LHLKQLYFSWNIVIDFVFRIGL